MKKFEIGQTYRTRSIGDHNCIISAQIVDRTAKTIKAIVGGKIKTFRPRILDEKIYKDYEHQETIQVEAISPWGNYSMSPTITAVDTKILKCDWD